MSNINNLSIKQLKAKFSELTKLSAIADNIFLTEYGDKLPMAIATEICDRGISCNARHKVYWQIVVSCLLTLNSLDSLDSLDSLKVSNKQRKEQYRQELIKRAKNRQQTLGKTRVKKSLYNQSEYNPSNSKHPFGHTVKSKNGKQGYDPELSLNDLEFNLDTRQKYSSKRVAKSHVSDRINGDNNFTVSRIDITLNKISDNYYAILFDDNDIGRLTITSNRLQDSNSDRIDSLPIRIDYYDLMLVKLDLTRDKDKLDSKIKAIAVRLINTQAKFDRVISELPSKYHSSSPIPMATKTRSDRFTEAIQAINTFSF